ncbi:hypothetical protein I6F19_22635 [Ensifer sp. BRP08]|nr:hypothetical protein [Ensifer sp. BRP08]
MAKSTASPSLKLSPMPGISGNSDKMRLLRRQAPGKSAFGDDKADRLVYVPPRFGFFARRPSTKNGESAPAINTARLEGKSNRLIESALAVSEERKG